MNSTDSKEKVESNKLSGEQLKMLQLSEEDINAGKLIGQEQLDKADLEWLKTLGF